MADWSSEQYLKFKRQRTLPAIDLANRIRNTSAKSIVDIGCGPGNSTAVLRDVFPQAELIGIDSSQNMIDKARESHPEIRFELCGACELSGKYDIIFSNACLQWIPEHEKLIPFLMSRLNEGGVLAVQIPINTEEPLFKIADEVVSDKKWGFGEMDLPFNKTLPPDLYYNILSECAVKFDIWETVYYHSMPSLEAMFEWIKGSRLRPYLQALDAQRAALMKNEILEKTSEAYQKTNNGGIILRFRRLFFTAQK